MEGKEFAKDQYRKHIEEIMLTSIDPEYEYTYEVEEDWLPSPIDVYFEIFVNEVLVAKTEKYKDLCLREEAIERIINSDFEGDFFIERNGTKLIREESDWEFLSELICKDRECNSNQCRADRIYHYLEKAESKRINRSKFESLYQIGGSEGFGVKFVKKGNKNLIDYLKSIGCKVNNRKSGEKDRYIYCTVFFSDSNGFDIKPK